MPGDTENEQKSQMVGDHELKEGEVYAWGANKPTGKSANGFEWSAVYGLDPFADKDTPSGWIGREKSETPKTKSKDDDEEGFGETGVWRHQDQDYQGDEAKRREVLGIPDPVPVDDD